jgi:HSP20 family protein
MDVKQSQGAATSTGRSDQTGQRGEQAGQRSGQADQRSDQAGQQGNAQREKQDMSRAQGEPNQLARRGAYPLIGPFALLQRILTDDVASLFDEQRGRLGRPKARSSETDETLSWSPKIDVTQRDDNLIVRADLPGMTPDDVTVEITDDAITLSGQRKQERVEENGGVYRLERSYGAFYREIPLPEGAIADRATASFKDGVLEITVPAPPEQVSRGRRVEITR